MQCYTFKINCLPDLLVENKKLIDLNVFIVVCYCNIHDKIYFGRQFSTSIHLKPIDILSQIHFTLFLTSKNLSTSFPGRVGEDPGNEVENLYHYS